MRRQRSKVWGRPQTIHTFRPLWTSRASMPDSKATVLETVEIDLDNLQVFCTTSHRRESYRQFVFIDLQRIRQWLNIVSGKDSDRHKFPESRDCRSYTVPPEKIMMQHGHCDEDSSKHLDHPAPPQVSSAADRRRRALGHCL